MPDTPPGIAPLTRHEQLVLRGATFLKRGNTAPGASVRRTFLPLEGDDDPFPAVVLEPAVDGFSMAYSGR